MSTRRQEALDYHSQGRPGKIQVSPTKPFKNQRDLSLAYTPGVAEPCREIAGRPEEAYTYTAKGNLVAVVTNGTAVLGLGNIGPLAGKPVMEGKGILFKAFADIDVFDLEVGSEQPDDVIRFCQLLEPTVGGINLEDIRSPDCFYIEEKLRETLSIPVFHDDQHGTAIISGAALLNALELVAKDIGAVQVVFAGAGAAAIATAEHYVRLGVKREHIMMCDQKGVISSERADLDQYKRRFARRTKARTLADALHGADVFVGLSVAGIVSGDMLQGMARHPLKHVPRDDAGDRQSDEHVGTVQRVREGPGLGPAREPALVLVQVGSLARDHALLVAHHDVLALDAKSHVVLGGGDGRGPGAGEHDLHRPDVLRHELQRVQERGARDDRRPVLVVVEDRDRQRLAQLLLDVETVWRADVLEVDAADGRLEQLAEPDHVVRLLRADLQVEHIDVGERLEQDPFALHHGLPRERPDVAEPEHGGPVRHHRYQVALRRVGVGLLRPPRDLTARLRHPRGVSEGQVALVLEGLGRR